MFLYKDELKINTDANSLTMVLDGNKIQTKIELYSEIESKFELTNYFGSNLDALYDVLNDLEWISAENINIQLNNFELFLSQENDKFKVDVMMILVQSCQNWLDGTNEEYFKKKQLKIFLPNNNFVLNYCNQNKIIWEEY